jgi:hypothetical protein
MQNFPIVISALTNIQNLANNLDIARTNVAAIHSVRYAKISAPRKKAHNVVGHMVDHLNRRRVVVRNIGLLFEAAENGSGVTPPTFPTGPNVLSEFRQLG